MSAPSGALSGGAGSGPTTRRQAANVAADPAAPRSVDATPLYQASWRSKADVEADAQRVLTAGQPHPDLAQGYSYGLSYQELRIATGVAPSDDVANFDLGQREFVFDADAQRSFSIELPYTIYLANGASITLDNASQLARCKLKGNCSCAARGSGGDVCATCSTVLEAMVKDSTGALHTLEALGLSAHKRSSSSELLLALMAAHAHEQRGSGAACLPPWFAPARPAMRPGSTVPAGFHKSYKTEVSPSADGFASGAHKGFRAVFFYACDFPGPRPFGGVDDPRCAAPMVVRIKDGSPRTLFFDFNRQLEHRHTAGGCVKLQLHRAGVCACAAQGVFPLPQPAGGVAGLSAAALLHRLTTDVSLRGAGRVLSPTVLFGAAGQAADPLCLLYRNLGAVGTVDQWEQTLKTDRSMKMYLSGMRDATPVEAGGPTNSIGRTYEKLVEYQKHVADSVPPGNLGPVMDVRVHPSLIVTVSTDLRLSTLVKSEAGEYEQQTGLNLDLSGGMALFGKQKCYELVIAKVLPRAAGGGRFAVAIGVLDTKRERAILSSVMTLKHEVLYRFNHELKPAFTLSDADVAIQNVIAIAFNNVDSYAAWLAHAKEVLDGFADYLQERDLLMKDELPAEAMDRMMADMKNLGTIQFLCLAHAIKTAIEHVMFGEHFKPFSLADRHFMKYLICAFYYPAVASPLFAGPHMWLYLQTYMEEVALLFSTGPRVEVGVIIDGVVLSARVRLGTAEDQKAGKPEPTTVFEAFIRGFDVPICQVRGYEDAATGECSMDVEVPQDAAAAVREAALAGLEGSGASAEQLAGLTSEQLIEKHEYTPSETQLSGSEADAEAEADGEAGASGGAAPAAEPAAAPARPSLEPKPRTARNPLYFTLTVGRGAKREVVLPLHASWLRRWKTIVSAGTTLRPLFEELKHRNNSNTTAEGIVFTRKYVDNTKADLPKPVEESVKDLTESMLRGDGQLLQQLAKVGDLTSARAVRAVVNGRAGAATVAAAAAAEKAAAPEKAAAKGKGQKGKAAAGAKAPPPRPEATLAALSSPPPRVDEESGWGPKRAGAPRGAGQPQQAAEADAPPAPVTALDRLRSLRGDVARSYNTLGEPITHEALVITAPKVGDPAAATAERAARAAVESMLTARRTLMERTATADKLVESATSLASRAARDAGAVANVVAESVMLAGQSGLCRICRANRRPGDFGCALSACGACCRSKRGRSCPHCDTHAERD